MTYEDIILTKEHGVARISINRPKVLNAFRTQTLSEIAHALEECELDRTIGVVVLTSEGEQAFCVGGDSKETGSSGGYSSEMDYWHHRVHLAIHSMPKPVIAVVKGYAIGGGNVLHVICDLTIAADNAVFGQAGPKVGSFDAGFGAAYLARVVGQKRAREIWFLCEQYSAQEALVMGLVNKVVPLADLNRAVDEICSKLLDRSPTALKFLKIAMNADVDSIVGIEGMSMAAVRLYWGTDEAQEGRRAYLEKRGADWSRFRK